MHPEKQKLTDKADLQLSGEPEYFGIKSPLFRAVAKYKTDAKARDIPKTSPDIAYGGYCVVREFKGDRYNSFSNRGADIAGYYLCRILDWESNRSWYRECTTVFCVVVDASWPEGEDMVGRIIAGKIVKDYWSHGRIIIGFGKKDFPNKRG